MWSWSKGPSGRGTARASCPLRPPLRVRFRQKRCAVRTHAEVAFHTEASGWTPGIRSAREHVLALTILRKCLENQGAKGVCQGCSPGTIRCGFRYRATAAPDLLGILRVNLSGVGRVSYFR